MNLIRVRAILFLLSGIVLAINVFGYTTPPADKHPSRPNIILLMSDDMGYECLSANGSLSYQTPNLDKLAENGMRFTQCHSQPLCTPSRVKIMTGRYNSNNYVDFFFFNSRNIDIERNMRIMSYPGVASSSFDSH